MPVDPRDRLVRYQSPFGLASVLDPPDDGTDPVFRPPQTQNLDTAPPPIPAPSPNAAKPAALSQVPMTAKASGPRKFAMPTMPPPETAAPPDAGPPPDVPAPTPNAGPAIQPPTPAADLAPKPPDPNSPTQRLAALKASPLGQQASAAPQSNWAQRLGLAVLSMTKLAPVANQIIHPKWSAQRAAFEQAEGDIATQGKIQEAEENISGLTEQRLATKDQREAIAEQKRRQADPHYGKVGIDPSYAPAMTPEADGKVWLDEKVAAGLQKQEKEPRPIVVPSGSTVVDSDGKVLFTAPVKPERSEMPADLRPYLERTGGDIAKAQALMQADKVRVAQESRPPRQPSALDEKKALNSAMNDEFNAAGGNWATVLQKARNGQLSHPEYAAEIADHADKMTKLPADAQRRVSSADATVDQVQTAIDAIDQFTKAHPDLTGSVVQHPLNAGIRKFETVTGTEPADIGAVDIALESAAALQPGQHNFRSIQALTEFKKALGIDPRTGKADGSRAWLQNPGKAKSALQGVADFNSKLKKDIVGTATSGGKSTSGEVEHWVRDPATGKLVKSNAATH